MITKGVTRNIVFIAISVIVSLFFVSSVFAADVAYIYRKDFKIDQNVLNVFNESGLSVELIDEKTLPRNFNGYKLIFVGDENFIKPGQIPVSDYPSIIMNYHHGTLWGLTDAEGVSQLGSTSPLTVLLGTEKVQVYTSAFKDGRIAVPYYFLDKENKADSLITIASAKTTSSGEKFGDVISYVQPGMTLENGKKTKAEICFFGIVSSGFWTEDAKGLFEDCVDFALSECQVDADCQDPFFVNDSFCLNDDIFQTERAFSCQKNGEAGRCVPHDVDVLQDECEFACSDGSCARCNENLDCDDEDVNTEDVCLDSGTIEASCDNLPIECFANSDCGEDGFIEDMFCTENDVMRQFETFTCSNPGTGASSCSSVISNVGLETCEDACVEGVCEFFECESNQDCDDLNVSTEDVCLNPSTLESVCTNEPIECFTNSDCGTDGLVGEMFCSDDNVTQDYETYTCANPGTSLSSCNLETSEQTIEMCGDYCNGGACKMFECHSDLECDDLNASTEDICQNPDTLQSTCTHESIECFTALDCGTDGFVGEQFCSNDLNLSQSFETFSCENPGTGASFCSSDEEDQVIEECTDICSQDQCMTFVCETDLDCDDLNESTEDTCLHPSTSQSECQNSPIECFANTDCGTDGFVGERVCSQDDVIQDYTTYACDNAGTAESSCRLDTDAELIETCEDACAAGICVMFECENNLDCDDLNNDTEDLCLNPATIDSVCQNNPIACFMNSDCGTDGFVGELFCSQDNILREFVSYTCSQAGTGGSSCSSGTVNLTVDECSDYCNAGACQMFACHNNSECDDLNVNTEDVCLNPSTLESSCTHTPIACFMNSDCGTDGFIGELFCAENAVAKEVVNYTCSSPGTGASFCSSQNSNAVLETCSELCSEGICIDIACFIDADCPADTLSEPFCGVDDDAYKTETDYFCANAGTITSVCQSSLLDQLFEDCQNGCEAGVCLTAA